MNPLTTFLNNWATTKAQPRQYNPVINDAPPGGGYYSGWNSWQIERQARLLLQTSWAFSAIQRIGMAFLQSEFQVKRRAGEDLEEIPNHPLELVIKNPNPDMSREFFWLDTVYSLYLYRAFWFMYPDQSGNIAEIWPMPFPSVAPIPDDSANPTSLFKAYRYTFRSGKTLDIPPLNVVYLRFPHPLDPYDAWPPTRAIMKPVVLDNAQSDTSSRVFDQGGGLPSSIVGIDPTLLGDGQFDLLKQELRESVNKRLVVPSGTVSVDFLQPAAKDVQFLESRQYNRDEIYNALGVPLATDKDSQRWFIDNTVWPNMQMVAGQVTTQITRPYFGEDVVAAFEDIRPQDRSLSVQESVQYAPFRSYNEERATRDEKPLDRLVIPDYVDTPFAGKSLYDDVPSNLVQSILPLILKGKPNPVPPQLQGFAGTPSLPGSQGAVHQQQQEEAQANPDGQQAQQDSQPMDPQQMMKAQQGGEVVPEHLATELVRLMKAGQKITSHHILDTEKMEIIPAWGQWKDIAIDRLKAGKSPAYVYLDKAIAEGESYRLATVLGHCRTKASIKAVFEHLDDYLSLGVKATLGTPVDAIPPERLAAEREFSQAIQEWLDAETIRIIQNTTNEPPGDDFWNKETALLLAFITPFVGKWAESGISETVTRINSTGLGVEADVNAIAANWANDHALELAKGLTATTRELAKAKIKTWLAGGTRNLDTLKASLGEVISPQWRANLIARSEVSRAFAVARQQVAEQLKIVKGMIFNGLEALCPICRGLNGKRRSLTGTYPGGYLIPVHPNCGCDESYEI